MDLRYGIPLADARLCEVPPTEGNLGTPGAARMLPGEPSRSVLTLRMRAQGRDHMPPIGPQHVDADGVALIDSWIRELRTCP
jgi:hypothetical protein